MYNLCMKNTDLERLARAAAQRARLAGITQSQIADALSASQSQVSRIFAGKNLRRTRLFDEVCIYVNNAAQRVTPEVVRDNQELMAALASVWDGTVQQASSIASVIRSLGPLTQGKSQDIPKKEGEC